MAKEYIDMGDKYSIEDILEAGRKLCNDQASLTEAKRNWFMEGFKVGYFQCLGDYVLNKNKDDVPNKYDPDEFFKAERKQSVIDNLVKRVIEEEDELIKHEVMANTVVLNGRKYGFLMNPGYYQSICGLKVEFDNLPDEMDFVVQKRPQTNADRIRAMSDDELAEAFAMQCCGRVCKGIPFDGENECVACWLDWLKRPVEVDE